MSAISLTNSVMPSTSFGETWRAFRTNFKLKKDFFFNSALETMAQIVIKNIFGSHHFGQTFNRGKKADIPLYVQHVKSPVGIQRLKNAAREKGLVVQSTTVQLEPFSEGVCYGATLFFAKRWLKLMAQNPGLTHEEVKEKMREFAKEFAEGAPLEATVLQAYHDILYDHVTVYFHKDLNDILETVFAEYPNLKNDTDRIDYWKQLKCYFETMSDIKCGSELVDALRQFLEMGKTTDQGLASFTEDYFKSRNEKLPAAVYSTLREFEEKEATQKGTTYPIQLSIDRHQIAASLAGLK